MSRHDLNPTSYPMGTDMQQTESEDDHSSPSRTEVENAWSYTSTPPYGFTVCYRDNFKQSKVK
jgi:hypothetical protein